MTTTNDAFLDGVSRKSSDCLPLDLGEAMRLVRLAERGLALEAALRGDPGHDVTEAVVEPGDDRTKSVCDWQAMGRALLASTGPFEQGVCRVCGCTRVTACDVPKRFPIKSPGRPDRVRFVDGSTACGWIEGTGQTLCDAPDCVKAGFDSEMIVRITSIETSTLEVDGEFEPLPPVSNEERECAPMAKVAGSDATLAPGRHDRGWRSASGVETARGWTNR